MAHERAEAVNGLPLHWVTTNWRLKLLSLVLSLGLVGAVAFSANPPTFDTASVRVQYVNLAPDLVLMNPPTSIDVPVAGLRDAVTKYKATPAGVSVNLTNAKPGPNQAFAVTPKIDVPGVTARSGVRPIRLTIDPLVTRQIDIEVQTPNVAPGVVVIPEKTYATCGNSNDHCQVTVSAGASIVNNLKAFVDYNVPLTSANPLISPNEPVKFESNGHPIDLNKAMSQPAPSWTPTKVTVQVATHGGSLTRTVGLGVRVTGAQACGYVITGVDVQPQDFVNVSGPIDQVAKLSTLPIDPIDVGGLTGSTTVTRRVTTPSNQITADLSTIRVTVGIGQAFSCAASSPTPAPPAQPTPSPSLP